jgi:hypothetical protein
MHCMGRGGCAGLNGRLGSAGKAPAACAVRGMAGQDSRRRERHAGQNMQREAGQYCAYHAAASPAGSPAAWRGWAAQLLRRATKEGQRSWRQKDGGKESGKEGKASVPHLQAVPDGVGNLLRAVPRHFGAPEGAHPGRL